MHIAPDWNKYNERGPRDHQKQDQRHDDRHDAGDQWWHRRSRRFIACGSSREQLLRVPPVHGLVLPDQPSLQRQLRALMPLELHDPDLLGWHVLHRLHRWLLEA